MSDGWEYYSAKDLNIKAVPFPGKRPYPNALDPRQRLGPARRLRRRRPSAQRGVPRLADHGQRSIAPEVPAARTRVAARLQRRHADQPRERDAGRAGVAQRRLRARRRRPRASPADYDLATRRARLTSATPTATGSTTGIESARGPGGGWWPAYWATTRPPNRAMARDDYYGSLQPAPVRGPRAGRPRRRRRHAPRRRGRPGQRRLQQHHRAVQDARGPDGNVPARRSQASAAPSIDIRRRRRTINAFNPCAPNRRTSRYLRRTTRPSERYLPRDRRPHPP